MSSTSFAIKNSILIAVLVLFVHKFFLLPASATPKADVPTSIGRNKQEDEGKDEIDGKDEIEGNEVDDVLAYVYGNENKSEKKCSGPPATSAKNTDRYGNMIIRTYDNEDKMCGGMLFESAPMLQGFAGSMHPEFQTV